MSQETHPTGGSDAAVSRVGVSVKVYLEAVDLLKRCHDMINSNHPVLSATKMWLEADIDKFLRDRGHIP